MIAPQHRFISKIEEAINGCWVWTGAKNKLGYGQFHHMGKVRLAHRVSWFFETGELLEPAIKLCHRCDNRSCVNPSHLFKGTQAENVADMISKGRARKRGLPGERNSQAKLTAVDVDKIRRDHRKQKDIAAEFGVAVSTISMVLSGKNWRAS